MVCVLVCVFVYRYTCACVLVYVEAKGQSQVFYSLSLSSSCLLKTEFIIGPGAYRLLCTGSSVSLGHLSISASLY